MFSTVKGFHYRKLEITVLGARPMSEVGFRDVKGQTESNTSKPSKPCVSNKVCRYIMCKY